MNRCWTENRLFIDNNKKQLALSSLTWYQTEYFTHMPCVGLCLSSAPEMMSHLCGFWWWRVRLEVRGLLTIAIMSIFWSRGLWLPASCASCGLLGLRPEQASAYPRPPPHRATTHPQLIIRTHSSPLKLTHQGSSLICHKDCKLSYTYNLINIIVLFSIIILINIISIAIIYLKLPPQNNHHPCKMAIPQKELEEVVLFCY